MVSPSTSCGRPSAAKAARAPRTRGSGPATLSTQRPTASGSRTAKVNVPDRNPSGDTVNGPDTASAPSPPPPPPPLPPTSMRSAWRRPASPWRRSNGRPSSTRRAWRPTSVASSEAAASGTVSPASRPARGRSATSRNAPDTRRSSSAPAVGSAPSAPSTAAALTRPKAPSRVAPSTSRRKPRRSNRSVASATALVQSAVSVSAVPSPGARRSGPVAVTRARDGSSTDHPATNRSSCPSPPGEATSTPSSQAKRRANGKPSTPRSPQATSARPSRASRAVASSKLRSMRPASTNHPAVHARARTTRTVARTNSTRCPVDRLRVLVRAGAAMMAPRPFAASMGNGTGAGKCPSRHAAGGRPSSKGRP